MSGWRKVGLVMMMDDGVMTLSVACYDLMTYANEE